MMELSDIEEDKVIWVDDDTFDKYSFFLKRNIEELLKETFSQYGLGVLVPGATLAIYDMAVDFSLQIRGVNKMVDYKRTKGRYGL